MKSLKKTYENKEQNKAKAQCFARLPSISAKTYRNGLASKLTSLKDLYIRQAMPIERSALQD